MLNFSLILFFLAEKDRNVNYLVWLESDTKRYSNRSRSLSQNGRIGKTRDDTAAQKSAIKRLSDSLNTSKGSSK